MTVRDAKPGQIIETLSHGTPTGNVYKIADHCPIIGKVSAYPRFTNIKVKLHPSNECRIIEPDTIDGFK